MGHRLQVRFAVPDATCSKCFTGESGSSVEMCLGEFGMCKNGSRSDYCLLPIG